MMKSSRRSMLKTFAKVVAALIGAVILAAILLATVPPLRALMPGIAQHIPAVGPAHGLTYVISGPSMEPEFKSGQVVNAIPLTDGHPLRCEVVIFAAPEQQPGVTFVERVVAIPGDTVSFGSLYGVQVNGKEPCPSVIHGNPAIPGGRTTTLAANMYFVVGDNFQSSMDSRFFGPVSRSSIIGYLP